MEGSIEEDNIAETNVISKASAVINNNNNTTLIKTANGQTVVFTGSGASTVSSISSVNSAIENNIDSNGLNNPNTNGDDNNNDLNSIHHQNTNKSISNVAQAIAASGGMSIVQLHLPNQANNMVQSVIQPNHQSVIQAPNTTALSTLQQIPKNVILLNKPIGQGSVIQSTESDHSIQVSSEHHMKSGANQSLNYGPIVLQLVKDETDTGNQGNFDEESKRRREILARRPSYRKILNELSATDGGTVVENKGDDDREHAAQTAISLPGYLKVLPASAIQIGSQDGSTIQGIPTIMTNTNTSASTIVQYATSAHDGQFIVPAADIQTYQLRPPNQGQNVVMTSTSLTPQILDEASKKRELRLLKNREAAKECRRKKKEYIKCLENRVAVLENQNKALIDELKTLKELYCKKSE